MAPQKDQVEHCENLMVHQDRVNLVHKNALPSDELQRVARTFKLLGDSTRLKIIHALQQTELCVCDLAAYLCLTESAVSHQLRRLKDMAFVKSRREGQNVYYSLDQGKVSELVALCREASG